MKHLAPHRRAFFALSLSILLLLSPLVVVRPPVAAQTGGRDLIQGQIKQLPARAKRYALVIGVDQDQDQQITGLRGAANDAKAIRNALVQYAGFPEDQVILLASDQPVEDQPTRGNILQRTPGTGPGELPLRSFEFDVVTMNGEGREIGKRRGQARYVVEDLGRGAQLEMVEVRGGTFMMGMAQSELGQLREEAKRYLQDNQKQQADGWFTEETPQHSVTVSTFYMGKFEVTQAQWRAVMGDNPSFFKGDDNLPVEQVSRGDAQAFCAKLSKMTGREYRLPSEAEWEYACRGGTTTAFHFGETITPDLVNYNGGYPYSRAKKGTNRGKTVPVGSLGYPNAYGLFDLHGNVWEWCSDCYHSSYNGAPTDGSSWGTSCNGDYRVLRGGSWDSLAWICRAAGRDRDAPGVRFDSYGFRVVLAARTR